MADSLQLLTAKLNLKFLAWIRARELQVPNKVEKFDVLVTAVVTRAGISVSEKQLMNIKLIFVTAAVLNSGIVLSEEQF